MIFFSFIIFSEDNFIEVCICNDIVCDFKNDLDQNNINIFSMVIKPSIFDNTISYIGIFLKSNDDIMMFKIKYYDFYDKRRFKNLIYLYSNDYNLAKQSILGRYIQ